MEKESTRETTEPRLPDLMEIIAMESPADKWRVLSEILQEPLRQEHSALPETLPKIDPSQPDWQKIDGNRGRMLWGPEGETLHLSRIDGTLYSRERFVRDQFERLTEYCEVFYVNTKEDPYVTSNPKEIASYIAEYQSDTANLDIFKLSCAKYNRDEASHDVTTYWTPPPLGGWRNLDHIGMVKISATREVCTKYTAGQPTHAYILENNRVASPQPELGPAFLLMRQVVGEFENGQLANLKAFERLGLYQPQAELLITRDKTGRFDQEINRA